MPKIRIIDFETTGTEPPAAEVCEAGLCDLDTGTGEVSHPESWLCGVSSMPPEVRAVHHISLEECKTWARFNPDMMDSPYVYAFAAHNSEFEEKFFKTEKPMICTYKAALRIWPDAPSHSNGALRYWLEDQGKIIPAHNLTQPAHRAAPDAYVTAWLLKAMLQEGYTVAQLIGWSHEPRLLPTCPIGKFRGKPWAEVEAGFLGWMLRQPDMAEDLKWNAKREIARRNGGIE